MNMNMNNTTYSWKTDMRSKQYSNGYVCLYCKLNNSFKYYYLCAHYA